LIAFGIFFMSPWSVYDVADGLVFSEINFLKDKKKEQSFALRSGLNEKKNASKN
jgi:hypothetical protein